MVYAKPPFGGPAQVLKYLARYTHRVAISNVRLLDLRDGRVTFRYKDYADGHKDKTLTLTAEEFLRRFVQHVLPKGFVKIRYYGLLANRTRELRLTECRRLLVVANPAAALPSTEAVRVEPAQPRCCAKCGGSRLVYRELEACHSGADQRGGTARQPVRSGGLRGHGARRADGVAADRPRAGPAAAPLPAEVPEPLAAKDYPGRQAAELLQIVGGNCLPLRGRGGKLQSRKVGRCLNPHSGSPTAVQSTRDLCRVLRHGAIAPSYVFAGGARGTDP